MKLLLVENFNQNGRKRLQHRSMGSSAFFFQDLAHVPSASELNVVDVVGGNTIIKVVITVSCPRLSNQKL